MTVGQLNETLTVTEEQYWLAYYREDPFGSYREDLRSAQISQLIHNVNAKKPRKLEDFMLFRKHTEKRQGIDRAMSQNIRQNFNAYIAAQKSRQKK